MNNKVVWFAVALVVILGAIYFIGMSSRNKSDTASQMGNESGATGRVVFSVTDAAVDMKNVSEININIRQLDVHSAASGWITVSTSPQSYDLLELNASGEWKLLAEAELPAGSYDQVKLTVDDALITTKAGVVEETKMPSNELVLRTTFVVKEDQSTSVNFDFLADQSLHVAQNGEYVFAPVVKTETRSSANVAVAANGTVSITGGVVDSDNTLGMDLDGSSKMNFRIGVDQRLNISEVDGQSVIELEPDGLLK